MIHESRIFGVYEEKGRRTTLFTKNLAPGSAVYGEQLVKKDSIEYREWQPQRSKIAAAIQNGCNNIFIREGQAILYLGASYGTTVSHVSDLIGTGGIIFAVEIAHRSMRDCVLVAEKRPNIAPILADAAKPKGYAGRVCLCDLVFQDITQRNQVEIFLRNCALFLKDGGHGMIAIKARSIDVTRKPKGIFREAAQQLEKEMIIIDQKLLTPYQLDHMLFVVKKKYREMR
ncbi:TPA: fibrillarin-like rRNA/tRNA 2'-O-methyltransferase [Candidatus Woesearchaeota archaeon]|nr:fibrillarin-like rRNA/tRNA 2'-O-methyltransferase [Candidatus Woesearchaeota archaeon]HII69315.1 fibrillarin-like rRNA/tRNA 2'-O-methyltransferase [Candidatus Woesearchaeota archaeon]